MTAAADWMTTLTQRRDTAKAAVLTLLARQDATGGVRTDPTFMAQLAAYRDAQSMVDALTSATS